MTTVSSLTNGIVIVLLYITFNLGACVFSKTGQVGSLTEQLSYTFFLLNRDIGRWIIKKLGLCFRHYWEKGRLRVVPPFSSETVERAKHERACLTPLRLAFLAWSDFHARSRFAPSTILHEKWGVIRSLIERKLKPCTDALFFFFNIFIDNHIK